MRKEKLKEINEQINKVGAFLYLQLLVDVCEGMSATEAHNNNDKEADCWEWLGKELGRTLRGLKKRRRKS